MKREGRLADKDPPRAMAKVDERKYAENYEYTTWDPTSTRTSRPAFGSDGKMDSLHFMSQDLVQPTMERSAWELGFDSAEELYPDSPANVLPDIWLVRRTTPKYNPRLVNRKGWYEGVIYANHENTLIYETELRLPKMVQSILSELNLIHLNDWCLQYNTAEMNDLLWKVKSYVTVNPVRLPDGLPTADTIGDFRLLSNGELVNVKSRLPEHVAQFETSPATHVDLCEGCTDANCVSNGVCGKAMKFGHNLTQWKSNWAFGEEKKMPSRRFRTAPKAWEGHSYLQPAVDIETSDAVCHQVVDQAATISNHVGQSDPISEVTEETHPEL